MTMVFETDASRKSTSQSLSASDDRNRGDKPMFYMDYQLDDDFSQAIKLQSDDDAAPIEDLEDDDELEDDDDLEEEEDEEEVEDAEAVVVCCCACGHVRGFRMPRTCLDKQYKEENTIARF
jgi:hypothetical protein